MTLLLQIISTTILGVVLGTPLSSSITPKEATLQVLQGNNQFTNDLYKVLSEGSDNVLFSPISAHVALSMAYQGARGTTAQRFAETLHLSEPQVAAEGYSAVMDRLNSVENVTLSMANRLYLMEGANLLGNFKHAITEKFQSEVQLLNFARGDESARIINGWVEEQTHDRIKDLFNGDDLSESTRLVLVNAIYFKGNWKYQFDEELTRTETFYLNDVDRVDVKMMHVMNWFNYKNDKSLDAQILEMPYSNEDLKMIIILPNKINGIKELEEKFENVDVNEISKGMLPIEVDVSLPRFKSEQTIGLKEPLTKLGLGEIFDELKANFSGMIELGPHAHLYVNKAVQKAFIEVNEEGAEAAAATGLGIDIRFPLEEEPVIIFKADHPFMYILADRRSTQLFMGRLSNPNL